jgi:hypothetical protein
MRSSDPDKYIAGDTFDVVMGNAAEDTVRELMRLRLAEERATFWMVRLTWVIALATLVLVVLTYTLVADALRWWPF